MDINSLRDRPLEGTMTVSDLNEFIKNMFDSNRVLTSVTVKGEISNFVNHRSGHMYFSLKDADSQLRAVMFRSSASRLRFIPENGMKVIIHGSVSVYSQGGTYQLYASSMQPDGIGALYLAYEQLKERLAGEGLFDQECKLPIPKFPSKVGVITSPTGAAVRDIINVTGRRYPLADIYLYPALVQGDGAEASLCRAVEYFEKSKLVDVVIIGRGGGSIEDLWAFNSEKLARLIHSATVPIISAVGHETDFTICDFVSDLRAPTPSAAAELAVPDIRELSLTVDNFSDRLDISLMNALERGRSRLESITSREIMHSPVNLLKGLRDTTVGLRERLDDCIGDVFVSLKGRMGIALSKLEALNPLSVLQRGYSVLESEGRIITSRKELNKGDLVNIRMTDGAVVAEIKNTEMEN